MKPNWHYYEAHINLAESKSPEVLAQYLSLLGLKVVDLVNLKLEGITSEEFGTITTMHSDNLADLVKKTEYAVVMLQKFGYSVQRYKIESTIIDSKYEDKFNLLG